MSRLEELTAELAALDADGTLEEAMERIETARAKYYGDKDSSIGLRALLLQQETDDTSDQGLA